MTPFLLFLHRLLDMVLLPFPLKNCVMNLEDNKNILMIGYAAFGCTKEMIPTTADDIIEMQARAAKNESTEAYSKAKKETTPEKSDDEEEVESSATGSDTTIQPDSSLDTDVEIVERPSSDDMLFGERIPLPETIQTLYDDTPSSTNLHESDGSASNNLQSRLDDSLGGEIDGKANVICKIISDSPKTNDEMHPDSTSSSTNERHKVRFASSCSGDATLDVATLVTQQHASNRSSANPFVVKPKKGAIYKKLRKEQCRFTKSSFYTTPQTNISSIGSVAFPREATSQVTKGSKEEEENPTISKQKPPKTTSMASSKPPLAPKTPTTSAEKPPHAPKTPPTSKTPTAPQTQTIPMAPTNTKMHQDLDTTDSDSKPTADEKRFRTRLQKIEFLSSDLQERLEVLDSNLARHLQAVEWSDSSGEGGAAPNALAPAAASSSSALVPSHAPIHTTKRRSLNDGEAPRSLSIEKQIQDDEAIARAIEEAERNDQSSRNISATGDNATATGSAVASLCTDFDVKLPAVNHKEQQLEDDEAIAKALQMEEDYNMNEEATRIAVSNETCDASMAATATGKAWRFVERILAFVASSSNKSGFQAVATDDLVFMAQRMFEAQEDFLNAGVPTEVDIGYHYTNEANMSKIQTEGLMTRPERQKNKIEADRFNGATYGEGIYTADDSARYSKYGNVGLVVARLKGLVMDASKAQNDYHHGNHSITKTFSAKAGISGLPRLVVLQHSKQCVAMVRYPTTMCEDRYFVETVSYIKKLVDEAFNDADSDLRRQGDLARKVIDELAFDSGDFSFQQPENSHVQKHTFNIAPVPSAIGAFAKAHVPFPFGGGNNNHNRQRSTAVPGPAQTTPSPAAGGAPVSGLVFRSRSVPVCALNTFDNNPTPVAPAAMKAPPNSGQAPPTAFPQFGNATAAAAMTAAPAQQQVAVEYIFSKNGVAPRVQACNLVTNRWWSAPFGATRISSTVSNNSPHCWGLTGASSLLMYHPSSNLPHSVQYIAALKKGTSSGNVREGMYTRRFDSECAICLSNMQDCCVGTLKCGHQFHLQCIREAEKITTQCPICRTLFAEPVGNMPSGTMNITFSSSNSCRGLSGAVIQIVYDIPSGVQSSNHANPGKDFKGANRTAYLPDTREGRRLLTRLVYAFSHGLTFTVGTSLTSGRSNVVTWSSIHHKTNKQGGVHGYPDPNYFRNVLSELDALGVPDAES